MGLLKKVVGKVGNVISAITGGISENPLPFIGGAVGALSPGVGIASGLYFVAGEIREVRNQVERGLALADGIGVTAKGIERRLGELVEIGESVNTALTDVDGTIRDLGMGVNNVAREVGRIADEIAILGPTLDARFAAVNTLIATSNASLSAQFREDVRDAFYMQALQDSKAALATYKSLLDARPGPSDSELVGALTTIEHDLAQAIWRMLGFSTFGTKSYVTLAPIFCAWSHAHRSLAATGLRGPFAQHDLTVEVSKRLGVFLGGYCSLYDHCAAQVPMGGVAYVHETEPDTVNFLTLSRIPESDLYLDSEIVAHLTSAERDRARFSSLLSDIERYLTTAKSRTKEHADITKLEHAVRGVISEAPYIASACEASAIASGLKALDASPVPSPSTKSEFWKHLIRPDNTEDYAEIRRRFSGVLDPVAPRFARPSPAIWKYSFGNEAPVPSLRPMRLKEMKLPRYTIARMFGGEHEVGDPDAEYTVWGWRNDEPKWAKATEEQIATLAGLENLSLAKLAIPGSLGTK